MIYIYYGEDRVSSEKAAIKILGQNHETLDVENIEPSDLPTIFLGTTLFETERKILIKDFFTVKSLTDALENYLNTPHEIVFLEQTFDKRTTCAKKLAKDSRVTITEFKFPEKTDKFLMFNIYDEALRNGASAAEKLRTAETTENPYAVIGVWTSKAAKSFLANPRSAKNKRILKELARIDILLKSSKFAENPWPVLELFLLNLKNL